VDSPHCGSTSDHDLGAESVELTGVDEREALDGALCTNPGRIATRKQMSGRRLSSTAAGGLINKEIGQRLCLSHRTVGGHLYQIFPKLGVTTRAALRDALTALSPG
jgi:hypothetical protein